MSVPFLFMIGIQATFVIGLVWFWMERWEGSGRLPSGSWLVAAIPVATLGLGLSLGPDTMVGRTASLSGQITFSIAATWLCYAVGALVTLHEAQARRVTA